MVTGYMSKMFLSTKAKTVSGARRAMCMSDNDLPRNCFAKLTNCKPESLCIIHIVRILILVYAC